MTTSSPTRPSADLQHIAVDVELFAHQRRADDPRIVGEADDLAPRRARDRDRHRAGQRAALLPFEILPRGLEARSEEHTSELQSLMRISYAVFCLKKNINPINYDLLKFIIYL